MDTNTIYDGYDITENQRTVVKRSFYTEMIKKKQNRSLMEKMKLMIIKWLS